MPPGFWVPIWVCKFMTTEALLDALRWRYATKRFDADRVVDATVWQALEDTLVLAPSSFGLQPWKFFVVTDPEVKLRLQAASWGQSQVSQASHLVVFARKKSVTMEDVQAHMDRSAEVREIPVEHLRGLGGTIGKFLQEPPYPLDLKEWASRQTYIALGIFLTAAALLGVDTSPMEGIDVAAYDKILGIEDTDYETVVACPTGHRHAEDKYAHMPKVRFPKSQVIERIAPRGPSENVA